MKTTLYLIAFTCIANLASAEQKIFSLTETHRGEYENGVYITGRPEFIFRFHFNPEDGKAILTDVTKLKTNEIVAMGSEFVLTASDSLPMLASPERMKEPLIILVGKSGSAITEVFMIGISYFEYVKVSSGKMYLASGKTQESISGKQNIKKIFQNGTDDATAKAKEFFERYVVLEKAFDPSQADLYSDEAKIQNIRTYPAGQKRNLTMPATEYKKLIRSAMPLAKARGDTSTYSDIKYILEGERVLITCSRFSELKKYSSPLSLLVGSDKDGKWLISEEISESQP